MKRVNKSINTEVNAYVQCPYIRLIPVFIAVISYVRAMTIYNTGFEYFVHFIPIHSIQSARPAGGHITVFCLLIGKINKISANLFFFSFQHNTAQPRTKFLKCNLCSKIQSYVSPFFFFFEHQNVENWLACRYFSLTSFFLIDLKW